MEMEDRVLSIQSSVVRGYVGNRAAAVPLNFHGIESDLILTCQLSSHTGYPTFRGSVMSQAELVKLREGMVASNFFPDYSHILSGYIGDASFLREVQSIVKLVPNVKYYCDPVLGDDGKFYVPEELVEIYRKEIVPLAFAITPNQFELESKMVVAGGGVCRWKFSVAKLPHRFVGTGDLFSVSMLIWLRKTGGDLRAALGRTLGTVQGVLAATVEHAERSAARGGRSVPGPVDLELRLVQNYALILDPPALSVPLVPLT